MSQGVLSYKTEVEERPSGATALGGLAAYMELSHVLNLSGSIAEHVKARDNDQGWSDSQVGMSLMLLQLAGGDCVDDLRILENDEGFRRLMQRVATRVSDRRGRHGFRKPRPH